MVVHFVVFDGGAVVPICGDWAGSPNWTRTRRAVTCPHCRELLEHLARARRPLQLGSASSA